jgi:hypothetical protein
MAQAQFAALGLASAFLSLIHRYRHAMRLCAGVLVRQLQYLTQLPSVPSAIEPIYLCPTLPLPPMLPSDRMVQS